MIAGLRAFLLVTDFAACQEDEALDILFEIPSVHRIAGRRGFFVPKFRGLIITSPAAPVMIACLRAFLLVTDFAACQEDEALDNLFEIPAVHRIAGRCGFFGDVVWGLIIISYQ